MRIVRLLIWPVMALVIVAIVAIVVYRPRLQWEFALGESLALERALRYYMDDHDGRLPGGFSDLQIVPEFTNIGGDVWKATRRTTPVFDDSSIEVRVLEHPAWFEVEWGAAMADVDKHGRLKTTGRPIVRPSASAPLKGLDVICDRLSYNLVQYSFDPDGHLKATSGAASDSQGSAGQPKAK